MTMQNWFAEAKLGIFLHWGIYAVEGVAESWSFYLGRISFDDYMRQREGFTAAKYDPAAWAELFQRAGARYAVLTARHHDGYALWPTAYSDRHTAADLLAPYAQALRDKDLKVGFYYSHSDWAHPDYASVRHADPALVVDSPYVTPAGTDDPEAWQRFLAYRDGQVGELTRAYRPDLLWFDGEWERAESQWGLGKLAADIYAVRPDTVLNARMLSHGDYATPEQGLPMRAPDGPWELCLTVNDSWGYQHADTNHKSVRMLVRYFAETIGMGGNLLLDVGPREDGTIPQEQADRLIGLGDWIRRHDSAVFGTVRGLPPGHHYGPSTLSADGRTLYLFCFDPVRDALALRGLRTGVRAASVLATGTRLGHRVTGGHGEVPGLTWIDAPPAADVDPHATVIAVELDGPLDLYTGQGRDS